MRSRSPRDRLAIDERPGLTETSLRSNNATAAATISKFTAVNGGTRPVTSPSLESNGTNHAEPRFNSASLWRPANGDNHGEHSRHRHINRADDGLAEAGISDDETIRVSRQPRKRKRSDAFILNNGFRDAANPIGHPSSPQPRSSTASRPEAFSKRRRSNQDVVNEWNAQADKECQPALHLITDDSTSGSPAQSSIAR